MTFRPADDILEQLNEGKTPMGEEIFAGNENSVNMGTQVFHSVDGDLSDVAQNYSSENVGGDKMVQIETPEPVYSPDLSQLLKENAGSDSMESSHTEIPLESVTSQVSSFDGECFNVENVTTEVIQKSQVDYGVQESTVQFAEGDKNVQLINNTSNQQISDNILDTETKLSVMSQEDNLSPNLDIQGTQNDVQEVDGQVKNEGKANPIIVGEGGDMTDEEKSDMISGVSGAIHSNLDFLVEKKWGTIVSVYQKIHRIAFKRGLHIFVVIFGIVSSVLFQVKASSIRNLEIIDDNSIHAQYIGDRNAVDTEGLREKGIDITPIVLYGESNISDKTLMIRDSLISYNGIVLPQVAYVNLNKDLMSIEEFNKKNITRSDLENVVSMLVGADYFNNGNKRVNDELKLVRDIKNQNNPKTIAGGLIDGFNLGCMDTIKVSNAVCDKALESLLKYGKYYDLVSYAKDVSIIMGTLQREGKMLELNEMCDMISEFTWYTSKYSSSLTDVVSNYCPIAKVEDYKKLIDFIFVNSSLSDITSYISEYPDINAYKLLSAQQLVYKSVNGAVVNSSFVGKYLDFVQKLIDKDAGKGNYIESIYKDLLYVFNVDELKYKIDTNSELKSYAQLYQQIENGNKAKGHNFPLKSQLTTPGIVLTGNSCTGSACDDYFGGESKVDLQELFLTYVSKTDRLIPKKYDLLSDENLKVQTEIYSSEILGANNGNTFKATITIHQKNGTLYIDTVKIHSTLEIEGKNYNWSDFNEILNMYIQNGNVELRDLLEYLDEQIWFWAPTEVETDTLCTNLSQSELRDVYTCDESSSDPIEVYKNGLEYTFILYNGTLDSFTISDSDLEKHLKSQVKFEMLTKNETLGAIEYILGYEKSQQEAESCVNNTMKKIGLVQQFSMHFHIEPTAVIDVDCSKEDGSNDYIVQFSLGGGSLGEKLDFQGNYNVDTHKLTKISYVASCGEMLEIRNLEIDISAENESQLFEIKNTPRIFFLNVNRSAFQKYQRLCQTDVE